MSHEQGLHSIAELPTYIRLADKLLSREERLALIGYLAEHPKAGTILEGAGGVRKLRWRRGGQGKSGGVRVIYYYLPRRPYAFVSADTICQGR
ncbi:hypothetical protein [Pigmentiphaga humi]|uniref:hypothetical protein n=1 Tax=Pigmentiphaga humi TaxID=2478468 RepID=UPI000F535FD6|nr:hypothetical protein [Pigmentiphaga humi]